MNRFFTKSIALVALVGAFTLVPAAKSEAAFDAWICNDFSCLGGGDVLVTEQQERDDTVALAGVISFNAISIGGMDITFNTSFSHPQVAQPQLDLAFLTTSTGAGDVWIVDGQRLHRLRPVDRQNRRHVGGWRDRAGAPGASSRRR